MSKAIIDINHGPFISKNNLGGGSFFDPDAVSYFSTAGISSGAVTPSAYDLAAKFNGSNQYLSGAFSVSGASFSVSAWINPSVISNYQLFVSGNTTGDFYVSIDPSGRVNAGLANISNDITSSTSLVANQWYNVVVTGDGSFLKIYINGNNVATLGTGQAYPISNSIQINGFNGLNYLFNGSIAGVGYWNSALNSAQVSDLYNGGIGRSPSYICYQSSYSPYIVSYWALNETSGASVYVDFNEINNLTPYGTPTNSVSPIATSTLPTQNLINSFVMGTKQLGLWNSMVCWPLRSSQNASSTLTPKSLGGYGYFPATIVNGSASTWTSTGISGSGSPSGGGQYISSAYPMPASPVSYYVALSPTTSLTGANQMYYATSGINVSGRQFTLSCSALATNDYNQFWDGYWPPANLDGNIQFAPANYNTYTSSKFASWRIQNATTAYASLNNSQGSSSISQWDSSAYAGTLYPVTQCQSQVAFSAIFNTFISNSLDSQISSLYKSTLGVGLALP